jgi:sec-independent protein translocase protein TatB
MFDIGGGELVLLIVIGLLVLGPQKLPKVAAEIGKWVGRARRTATQLRRQLEREIELAEIQPPQQPPPGPPPQTEPAPDATKTPEQQVSDALSDHAATPPPPEVSAVPAAQEPASHAAPAAQTPASDAAPDKPASH